jgi:hypothetical protein
MCENTIFTKGVDMMKLTTDRIYRRSTGAGNNTAIIAVAVIIALILLGLIVFFVIKGPKGPAGLSAKLASYYPQDTVMYAELNLEPHQVEEIKKLSGGALNLKNLQKAAENPSEALEGLQLIQELDKTLEPTFAMGVWASEDNKTQPDNVVFASIVKNPEKIADLMNKLTENKANFEAQNIEGVEYQVANDKTGGAYVVVNDVLLFSDKVNTLQQSIKYAQSGQTNVLETDKAKEILGNLPGTRILTILLNTSGVSQVASQSPQAGAPGMEAKLKQLETITNSMSHTGIGVELKDKMLLGKSFTPYNLKNVEDPALKATLEKLSTVTNKLEGPKLLPKDVFMYISISGISHFYEISTQMVTVEERQQYEQQKQMVKMMTQLDLEGDIIPIFTDEVTVGAKATGNMPEPIILLSGKPNSLQVLNKLVSVMGMMDPSASISETTIDDVKVNVINTQGAPFNIAYGQVGDLIAMSMENTMKSIIEDSKKPEDTLQDLKLYQNLSKNIQPNPNFVMYMNADQMAQSANKLAKSPAQVKQIQEFNKNIEGILISIGCQNNDAIVGNMAIKLKPVE